MIMTHGDNKGLVLPPRVAPKQVVIIPIPNSKAAPELVEQMINKVYVCGGAPCVRGMMMWCVCSSPSQCVVLTKRAVCHTRFQEVQCHYPHSQ
jgi:hypothetical protein